jgi:anti-sigma B factor antagonist
MTDATVQVYHEVEGVVRMTVTGEIDMENAGRVEQQFLDAISNQLTNVVLDLGGVDYIDSAGLRVLFTLGTRLDTLQIALELVVPADSRVRRVIDLCGLSSAIRVASE